MSTPPNILWLCTDQQRWDTLGCYGNPFVHTPNLDHLAEKGVLFEHAYCQSPVCTPSRASFLTGRYPRTTRCRQNGQSIPEDEVLVTKLLADAGYVCGLSGKLHLSACNPSVNSGTERRIDDGYDLFHWSHHSAPLPPRGSADNNWPTNEYNLWLREKGVEFMRTPFRESPYVQVSVPEEHHQTTWSAQKAIDFIEANAGFDQPWLFSVNFYDPHHAFDPPESYLQRYLDRLEEIPLPNYEPGELGDKPLFQQIDHEGAYGGAAGYPFSEMSDNDHRLIRAAYWAMCDLVDAQVGRVLAALERTGQLENTLVIFMSDHGEMLGDHGIYLKGPYFYEPAIRVPLILSWPGKIPEGERREALIELVDLAPTLLEAAGVPLYPGMQGHSLSNLLEAEEARWESVYCEYYNAMPWHKHPAPHATMLRTERYKLVTMHGLGTGELYDLLEDSKESRNLWSEASHSGIKLELLQLLCDRMAETVDPLPLRRAAW